MCPPVPHMAMIRISPKTAPQTSETTWYDLSFCMWRCDSLWLPPSWWQVLYLDQRNYNCAEFVSLYNGNPVTRVAAEGRLYVFEMFVHSNVTLALSLILLYSNSLCVFRNSRGRWYPAVWNLCFVVWLLFATVRVGDIWIENFQGRVDTEA